MYGTLTENVHEKKSQLLFQAEKSVLLFEAELGPQLSAGLAEEPSDSSHVQCIAALGSAVTEVPLRVSLGSRRSRWRQ